ncbi:alpha-glycosidase [Paenibacillus sedimenti]|uniref:Alpha-glycosidase n=1 Tax=Paenibacillus sedimenti TaxID=2770274 RepID=A0A926QIE5_9BACL|nr:alpha-glycosidase [Paenibacillus sedimenti]MBD0380546.1 alpha-glycosidase [Paenibacillus sedimenti]
MNRHAIYHRAKQNWSYAYDLQTLHIRIRTQRGDVDRVDLLCGDKYAWEETHQVVPMSLWVSDHLFDYWTAEVRPPFRRLIYWFALHHEEETLYLSEKGLSPSKPINYYEGVFDFPYLNAIDIIDPPAWVKDAIFYQIFPERFANGVPSISPVNVEPWGGTPTPKNFFGGDLQGVIDRLDHLTALGVNAIYFNPLFKATTNHKYDTTDYLQVDPQFGTNDTLKTLVKACHERGIRVLLDAVFNHSGKEFAPFADCIRNGAKSRYADWFHVRKWPIEVVDRVPSYETFAFEPLMPKLNTENPEVKAYLLEVARYWIEEVGIDGWRLDVANEVDHHFWRDFRKTVKAVKPDAYILGEINHDSMPWLQGDQFDAIMNYPFTNAVNDFFLLGRIDAAGLAHRLSAQLASYPQQVNEVAFNLLGSHDTDRILSLAGGNTSLVKLATLFQHTFLGVPCIYYGDEIGLDGGHDPANRKCMEWDERKQDLELFQFFKEITHLRHTYPALRTGKFTILLAEENDGRFAYERSDGQDQLIILLNRSTKSAKFELLVEGAEWINVFTNESMIAKTNKLKFILPAYGYAVFKAK